MTEEPDPRDVSSSLSALMRIEGVCLRFEEAWKQGDKPRIEDYLDDAIDPEERRQLLRELLLLDLDYRARSEPEASEDEYQARFPQDTQLVSDVFEALSSAAAERGDHKAGSDLDAYAARADDAGQETASYGSITEGPGAVIDHYKLLQEIGAGGFGVVYMAEQLHPLRRKVALKIIKPGMDTREVIARFEAERQALALMDHPNIASVLDAGTTDSGRPYFVMELVKGVPITEFCDRNELSPRERLELFVTVCHAVHHAHQKGIIHRDIKPSNTLVTLQDGEPLAKVIDFGVAKAISQQLTEKTLRTAYGQMVGTKAYMSPEQAEMSSLDLDTRGDIYSLGVLLYELLTGATPFDSKRLHQAGYAEMQRIIREETPPTPSTRLSTLGDSLSIIAKRRGMESARLSSFVKGDLDWIVMKALEKQRSRRYDTASGLAADVQRFLKYEAVEARPPSTAYRLRKFARRNKQLIGTVGTVAVVLVLATLVSTWHAIRSTDAERQSTESADWAERERKKAQELADQNSDLAAQERRARLDTERQLRIAAATRLAAQSHSCREKEPTKSLLLAFEAVQATLRHGEQVVPIAHESLLSALQVVEGAPLTGHEAIREAAISSDGHWLVTAGGNTAKLWDLTVRHPWLTAIQLPTSESLIYAAAFSPDSRWLVLGNLDGTASLWDLGQQTVDRAFSLRGHETCISTVAFSPDSRWLATQCWDFSVRLWDLTADDPASTGEALSEPQSGKKVQLEVIVTADGPWLVAPNHRSPWRGVRLWDMRHSDKKARLVTTRATYPAAISPNGRWLVLAIQNSGSPDQLHLLDLTTEALGASRTILSASEASGWLTSLAFSDDSRLLAMSNGNTAHVWDLTANEPEFTSRVLRGHQGGIYKVAISRDGNWLVTGGEDGAIRVWDLTAENPKSTVRAFGGHDESIHSIAISPDDRWLVTGSADNTARVWDLTAKDPTVAKDVLRGHDGHISILAISPDGHWLVTASRLDAVPRLWDLTAEKLGNIATVFLAGDLNDWYSSHFSISPDGHWLAVGFPLRLCDLTAEDPSRATRNLIDPNDGHRDQLSSDSAAHDVPVAISAKWLVTTRHRYPRLWNLSANDSSAPKRVTVGSAPPFAISVDERWLVTGTNATVVHLLDLTADEPKATARILGGHRDVVTSIAVSPDSRRLVTLSADEMCRVWDLTAQEPKISAPRTLCGPATFSETHRWLVTSGGDNIVCVWDLIAGELTNTPQVLSSHEDAVRPIAISPDGRWLVTKSNGRATLWDLSVKKPTGMRFRMQGSAKIGFSLDSHWLVALSDGITTLWDLSGDPTLHAAKSLHGHRVFDSVAFSPDSRWLATAGIDGTTQLWDLARADPVPVTIRGHEDIVRMVEFSADGSWLVTKSDDGTVRLWDASLHRLIERARRQAGRELTSEERQEYQLDNLAK